MYRNKPWIFRFTDDGDAGGAPADNAGESGDSGGEDTGFKPITSQEDLNKIIGDRVSRERSKYADYKDLKSKASEYDKLQEASKSELQKAQEAKQALEDQLAGANTALLRRDIAAEHGITDKDDIELFLTGTDKETLTKQAKRLADRAPKLPGRKHRPGDRPSNNGSSDDDERQAVRSLFGS